MSHAAPSIEEQTHFYDARWRDVRFVNAMKLQRAAAILEAIGEADLHQPRMLELGCGTGWLTAILAQFGPTVGVELSGEAVEAARARFPFAEFAQIDIGSWQPEREGFDVIVSHEVVEHLEDQRAHLALARHGLRRGGLLVLTTPNADTVRASETPSTPLSDQLIEHVLPRRELVALVASCGFEVVRHTTLIGRHGTRGVRRLLNSPRLRGLLASAGLLRTVDRVSLAAGAGLHTLVVARRT
ncbi:putative 3-demethylubiquinone-9 3-methyltransferase [Gemmatirosa kalamazoonensis]|uniref:Putative 3-demethylubiquinone-9 3-methyltransferase n=1 Tax=Gemmatirosa kalamazoonensis TaxID=861299 RepID=W0RHW1_9BACT|nr:class I SAM-dependent methyltransferase [Gemmatirosa kalamazoonensis]AHG90017.1 putative 3-demethylubiquinone-9 3-methyltransferase [Gemmatirosa kalamazoonensis]